jgi:hypothetical protein
VSVDEDDEGGWGTTVKDWGEEDEQSG